MIPPCYLNCLNYCQIVISIPTLTWYFGEILGEITFIYEKLLWDNIVFLRVMYCSLVVYYSWPAWMGVSSDTSFQVQSKSPLSDWNHYESCPQLILTIGEYNERSSLTFNFCIAHLYLFCMKLVDILGLDWRTLYNKSNIIGNII